MATKAQAKAAIDAAVVQIKNDMDITIPANANYKDGSVSFSPTRWNLVFSANNDETIAETLFNAIKANLNTQGRGFSHYKEGRRNSDATSSINISTILATYSIVDFKLTKGDI